MLIAIYCTNGNFHIKDRIVEIGVTKLAHDHKQCTGNLSNVGMVIGQK